MWNKTICEHWSKCCTYLTTLRTYLNMLYYALINRVPIQYLTTPRTYPNTLYYALINRVPMIHQTRQSSYPAKGSLHLSNFKNSHQCGVRALGRDFAFTHLEIVSNDQNHFDRLARLRQRRHRWRRQRRCVVWKNVNIVTDDICSWHERAFI